MHVFVFYIHNKYTQYTNILYIMETKTFILDAITRFTTLFKIHYNRKQAILLFIPYF